MSYDGFRSPPPQSQPGFYEHNESRYLPPGSYQSTLSNPPNYDADRYRPNEAPPNPQEPHGAEATMYKARQPITDVVTSAVNSTNNTTSSISPDVLSQLTSQITASVIEQLKATTLASPTLSQAASMSAPVPNSPTTLASVSVDHPPPPSSPHRAPEEAPQTLASAAQTQFVHIPRSQDSPPQGRRVASPISQTSQADDSEPVEDRAVRPKGPKRLSTSGDPTIIEKTWGALFTEDGQSTTRLGQFLRGIAVHIIEDYEPKHSLVITPTKLQKYYEDTKLSAESYSWQTVFDNKTSSISRLFRDFEAQHHLVQERLDKRPSIPGLTPQGFERWATLLLRAHPDQEFDRLAKTALDMPISNPDDRKERFPKELSRRLFPKDSDTAIAHKLQRAIREHCGVHLGSKQENTIAVDPQPSQTSHRTGEPAQPSPMKASIMQPGRQDSVLSPVVSHTSPPPHHLGSERERNPYSNVPSESAFSEDEDGDDVQTPQPIERERKPYVSQPGGGRNYEDVQAHKPPADYIGTAQELKPSRTVSVNHGQAPEYQRSRPVAIHQRPPPPSVDGGDVGHARSNSVYNRDAPSRIARQRSPSLNPNGLDYGHRSEGNVAFLSYPAPASNDVIEDARRHRDYESQRERNAGDRYDAARMAAYDPRDRERDARPRGQSTVGLEGQRQYEDEYLRTTGQSYAARDPYQQYPPNTYRG